MDVLYERAPAPRVTLRYRLYAGLDAQQHEEEMAALQQRLSKKDSELAAARAKTLETERLKMASEQLVLNLKEEKLRLEEATIAAEEQALVAQEESDGKDTALMDAREAQMKAEIRAEQLMQRLESVDSKSAEAQAKADEFSTKYKESHQEVVSLEEEKYQLIQDVETLEEELEEAHTQAKRYFDVVEAREAEMTKMKEQLKEAKAKQDRLAYEKELAELHNNPIQEGGGDDLEEVYATIDKQKESIASKERTIAKLERELDQYKLTVDEEPPRRHLSLSSAAASNQNEDSDDFGSVQAQSKIAADKKAAENDAKAKRAEQDAVRVKKDADQLARRADTAEKQLAEANSKLAAADRAIAQKEAEVLKLIMQRDNGGGGGGGDGGAEAARLKERESELEEEMAYLNQQLEEEQQAREEIERELEGYRGGGSPVDVQQLRLELEDMRVAKERAEAMLEQAMPG